MLEKKEYTGHMMSKEHGSLCMVGFSVDFIPTTLNDQEVYEVKKENDHYCYMTPAMVDKIFELIPGSQSSRYVDQFSFDLDNKTSNFVKLKNKLLLDLPDNVDANSFASMRFSFVQYTKDVKKEPVVLKVKRQYAIENLDEDGGAIELIFPDNKIECNNFKIYTENKIDQVLEINAKNGKMDAIFVNHLTRSEDIGKNDIHLSVSFKDEEGILFIQGASIPYSQDKHSYINFKTGKTFHLNDVIIQTVYSTTDLSSVQFDSSKDIYVINSTVRLQNSGEPLKKGQVIGIKGDGDISISNSVCGINNLINNNGGLYVSQKKKRGEIKRFENKVTITDSSLLSPTYISAAKNKPLLIKQALIDNGKARITIDGNSLVFCSKIFGNNNKPITISDSSVRLSTIMDTNEIAGAIISNAEIENCLIENDKGNKRNILIGPQINAQLSQILDDEDMSTKWTLKNCQIKIDKGYMFRAVNFEGAKFVAENSTFDRGFTFMFYIDEDKKEEIKDFTFNIKNSLINRSSFSLAKGPYGNFSTTSVINSEINDSVIFSGLELLKDSIANYNTQLSGYSKVDSCFFDGGITKDAKDGEHELIGYNTAASSYVEEPKKEVGKVNNELEIL